MILWKGKYNYWNQGFATEVVKVFIRIGKEKKEFFVISGIYEDFLQKGVMRDTSLFSLNEGKMKPELFKGIMNNSG
jgi:hypothetical protein